jgi:hypothetical protein
VDGKLTKKYFMSLPEAVFLISNMMAKPDQSVFEEYILPQSQREEQWKRIVNAGAHGRLCHTFDTRDQAKAMLAEWHAAATQEKKPG